jgi:hypothetical protein
MLDESFIGTHRNYQPMVAAEVPLDEFGLTAEQFQAAEVALAADPTLHGKYFTESSNGYEHPATDAVLNAYCELVGLA